MASIDTAESAVADDDHLAPLSPCSMKVHALAGDRGASALTMMASTLKIDLFPPSKANSPPEAKGGWRRPVPCCCCCSLSLKPRKAEGG